VFISVDMRNLEKALKDLERARSKAIPYATRAFVNDAAFEARKRWGSEAKSSMTLRSPWTLRSIQVDKATSLADPAATVGSTWDAMADQEDGKTYNRKGKYGIPIPGAAPGRRKNRGRTPAKNQLANIQVVGGGGVTGIRQRRNAAAISIAARKGGGVVFLDLRRTKGLYRVSGTKRGIKIKKVWDLSKKSVRLPSNPMLHRTLHGMMDELPRIALKATVFQLRRHKVFGY
jgi:hypothetical protein